MKEYIRGEAATIEDEFKDKGTLTTPNTSYTIEIDDPFKTNVVDGETMEVMSTGVLRYNYAIADNATTGLYKADTIYVHKGVATKLRHRFRVKPEVG